MNVMNAINTKPITILYCAYWEYCLVITANTGRLRPAIVIVYYIDDAIVIFLRCNKVREVSPRSIVKINQGVLDGTYGAKLLL